ncbi:hypothetical protein IAU60_002021 [Kwoniella sp. DSM 27419]
MFGYYPTTARRRSSSFQSIPTSPQPRHYSSAMNESQAPSLSPHSPHASSQIRGGDLGSPFSMYQADYHDDQVSPEAGPSHQPRFPSQSETVADAHPGSVGSTAPLVSRDFGLSGSSRDVRGNGAEHQENGKSKHRVYPIGMDGAKGERTNNSSESFVVLPGGDEGSSIPRSSIDSAMLKRRDNSPLPKSKATDDPSMIPPPSVHDEYVSRYLRPIAPTSLEAPRPALNRSSSAPGHPNTGLLPSAMTEPAAEPHRDTNQPIFKIFDANLSEEGVGMSKKLRAYLDMVLKGQEEVGRMHLELEGLGMTNNGYWEDANAGDSEKEEGGEGDKDRDGAAKAEKREKGIDEIMRRLDSLSDTLRNYHQLGTPALAFPRQATQPVPQPSTPGGRDKSRTQSASSPPAPDFTPGELNRARTTAAHPSPEAQQGVLGGPGRVRAPTLLRSNTAVGQVSPTATAKEKARPRSPLINTFNTFSSSEEEPQSNNMDQYLSDPPPGASTATAGGVPFPHKGSSPERHHRSFWEGEPDKDGGQGWLEDVLGHHGSPSQPQGRRERRITDSPVEMNFKSRW